MEMAIAWDWLSFALRWLHVITAIAWIGSSFYFIALDLGLRKAPDLPKGAHGEEWQVHGGGFYHIRKYLVAPAEMPEHLTWFKWESYATWLSGFALMAVVYYAGADLYLIDANVLEMSQPVAIAVSIASIAFGWIVYDLLCKSPQDLQVLSPHLYFDRRLHTKERWILDLETQTRDVLKNTTHTVDRLFLLPLKVPIRQQFNRHRR